MIKPSIQPLESGFVVWLTGLPSAGKTTIARALEDKLRQARYRVEVLDGDSVRKGLSPSLGFSKEERIVHNRRVIYLSKLLARNGVVVIVSLISPYRATRAFARSDLPLFMEVFIKCDVKTCIERDVKGLYARALKGEITNMTGVHDPYEEPVSPEVIVETDKESIELCTERILTKAQELGYLSS